jgi:hypothetical protein
VFESMFIPLFIPLFIPYYLVKWKKEVGGSYSYQKPNVGSHEFSFKGGSKCYMWKGNVYKNNFA